MDEWDVPEPEVDDAEPAARNSVLARLQPPLGQGAEFAQDVALARRLRLPHALVITGLRGGGKSTVLQWLAAALLCPSTLDETEPCGGCRTCARVASGQHPDLHRMARATHESEVKQDKLSFTSILVRQVRAAQEALARHAVEGRARVLCIHDADAMENEAQNALLKTLEEPGENTFLLLEATRVDHLLPTVRSRARSLRVLPLRDDAIRAAIVQKNPTRSAWADRAVTLARGSLGLAQLAMTERAVHIHDLVTAMLAAPNRLRPVELAQQLLHGATERREELAAARLFLWLLAAELRAVLDRVARPAAASYGACDVEPWTTWLEHCLHAERDLQWHIPVEPTLVALLVAMRRS